MLINFKSVILMLVVKSVTSSGLSGFLFEDNKSPERYISDNGEITYTLPSWPHQIGCCFTVFINFDRYSSIVPLVDFRFFKFDTFCYKNPLILELGMNLIMRSGFMANLIN